MNVHLKASLLNVLYKDPYHIDVESNFQMFLFIQQSETCSHNFVITL